VIAVVGTNGTWGMVSLWTDLALWQGPRRCCKRSGADALRSDCRGYGGYGENVTQPKDIRPALERARASGKPACVNVMVDPEVYSPTTLRNTFYKY